MIFTEQGMLKMLAKQWLNEVVIDFSVTLQGSTLLFLSLTLI